MNRRDFTLDAAALVAIAAFRGSDAAAAESEPAIGRAARELHRRAIVLDANLAPPAWYNYAPPGWDPDAPELDHQTAAVPDPAGRAAAGPAS